MEEVSYKYLSTEDKWDNLFQRANCNTLELILLAASDKKIQAQCLAVEFEAIWQVRLIALCQQVKIPFFKEQNNLPIFSFYAGVFLYFISKTPGQEHNIIIAAKGPYFNFHSLKSLADKFIDSLSSEKENVIKETTANINKHSFYRNTSGDDLFKHHDLLSLDTDLLAKQYVENKVEDETLISLLYENDNQAVTSKTDVRIKKACFYASLAANIYKAPGYLLYAEVLFYSAQSLQTLDQSTAQLYYELCYKHLLIAQELESDSTAEIHNAYFGHGVANGNNQRIKSIDLLIEKLRGFFNDAPQLTIVTKRVKHMAESALDSLKQQVSDLSLSDDEEAGYITPPN